MGGWGVSINRKAAVGRGGWVGAGRGGLLWLSYKRQKCHPEKFQFSFLCFFIWYVSIWRFFELVIGSKRR